MALMVEGIMDGGMHTEKALGGSSRFEPLHFALSSRSRLTAGGNRIRTIGPGASGEADAFLPVKDRPR